MFNNAKKTWKAISVLWRKQEPKNDSASKPKPEPAKLPEKVETPQPVIGCLAKTIIKDLAPENADFWDVKWGALSPSASIYGFIAKKKGKKGYSLMIQRSMYGNSFSISIKGMSSVDFNSDESVAIGEATDNLHSFKNSQLEEKQKAKDLKKLEKLFPDCYPPF
jgi:hypothetical protein